MPALPFKRNQDRRHRIPKRKHKVMNWREYDESLCRRGSLTVWFSDAPCCTGRPCGRIEPYPCSGSCGADVLGASEVQHPVQHVGGDRHLGRLTPIGP